MAFAVITLENKKITNQMKLAPVGYSWTNLFFGFFVPIFRGDWKWGIIFLAVGIVTAGFLFFGFFVYYYIFFFSCWNSYNKLYASDLLQDGFKVKNLNGADKELVKIKLGIARL